MRLRKANKKYSLVLLSILLVFVFSSLCFAQEISLQEAIKLGLDNDNTVQSAQDNVDQLQRNLSRIAAQENWQVDLGAGYNYTINQQNDIYSEDQNTESKSLDISASRTLPSGLTISPKAVVSGDDFNTDLSLEVSQSLYPSVPTEQRKSFFKDQQNLLQAQGNLLQQKATSVLNWLDSYLNLERMAAKQQVYQREVKNAQDNLNEVEQRFKIGDAGQDQLLTSRLGLENAKYSLKEAENNLSQARYTIKQELGLAVEQQLNITDQSTFLNQLKEKVGQLTVQYLKQNNDGLLSQAAENSYDLQANLLDRKILNQELSWLKEANKPELDLKGSYDSDNDETTIGLELTYPLFDSGLHQLDLNEQNIDLANNKDDYNDSYNQLKLDLKKHLDKLDLAEMALTKGKLNVKHTKYELDAAQKQLKLGLIDYLDYQDYWVSAEEAKTDLQAYQDQLFMDRLQFIKFLNISKLDELMGGF